MDGRWFDAMAKSLASQTSRRAVVRSIGAGVIAGFLGMTRRFGGGDAEARMLGEACSTTKDCSGNPGIVCCGAGASGKKGTCVDVDVDTKNCGTCGTTCPEGRFCTKGRCCSAEGGTCETLYNCCRLDVSLCCNGMCVFGEDASQNCGSCGHVCQAGEACCRFTCVNLDRDADNCGTCKYQCPRETHACCSGRCLNIKNDSLNCGGCGNQCKAFTEVCEDGTCVKAKQTSAPGETVPNLAYAALQPSDLGSGYQLERGLMVYAPAALGSAGVTNDLIEALSPGFGAAIFTSYQQSDESGAVDSVVSVMRAFYDSDAAALAAVETMFFSHTSYQADMTGSFPFGDKGYTLLFEQPNPDYPEATISVLETGMYVGPMLTVVATSRAGAAPNGDVHGEVTRSEEEFARLVASGQAPDGNLEQSGLAPLALQIAGVKEATFFPSRIGETLIQTVGQSAESRRNTRAAHGDASDVWLNNFALPDSPYRIFNRLWAFDSAEAARAFGEQMPGPLLPTYASVGIALLDGKGTQLVADQVAFDFTWPQADGAWLGYQVLFPLDRFYISVSVADVAGPADVPLLLRANAVMLSFEEIVRQYLEQLAELIGTSLPFTLLPQIKPNALMQGKQPEAGEGQPSDASSSWSFERGKDVEAQLLVYGKTIDRGERPEVMPCDKAFVIRSYWEDKTVRTCDGYSGAKDGETEVCKTALKNAQGMAATIPCPKEDCTRREEIEIWRGWRCFEDEPEKGDHAATCAVQLKLTCNGDVRP